MKHVLFLPKWYPNRLDPFDGNFIENHAHAIKKIANISVLFVHSDYLNETTYEVLTTENQGLIECRVFYKKANTSLIFLNKLINFYRFRKAQQLGYKKLFPSSKPDFCHIHVLSRTGLLALQLKKSFNIPFLITEHWSGYLPYSGEYKGVLKKWFTKILVKKSNGVHTVTTQLANAMKSHGLINRYTVIPNVVDIDLFKPIKKENNDKIKILFVGNILQRPKKIFDILNAIQHLTTIRKDFELNIYGEGDDETNAKKLVVELNIENFVKFNGTTDRKGIGEAMAKSDFLILFSEFENQPCVIGEAQSCGIPVVLPNLKGIEEFMTPELGLLVEHMNLKDFIIALEKMCNSYSSYKSQLIREYAIKTFSEDSIAQAFKIFYQESI